MTTHLYPNTFIFQRLHDGPLRTHVDLFSQTLSDAGYAMITIHRTMRLLADFSVWMQAQKLAIPNLSDQAIDTFLEHRYQALKPSNDDRPALDKLFKYLRASGQVAPSTVIVYESPHQFATLAFEQHLISRRNLASRTVNSYLRKVAAFIDFKFGNETLTLEALCSQDITDFILHQARRYSVAYVQLIASALRSFFKFLFQSGITTLNLALCVPAPAKRRCSTLPKFIDDDDVDILLKSINQATAKGCRDYAIILLLVRLGLRACEVTALTLDDLNWDAGEITVHSKGWHCDRLPLIDEVGQALADYLHKYRPACQTRQVFICMRPPLRGFTNSNIVTAIVRNALMQAQLNPAHKGAHLLRHSLATRLLRNGASLTEIGDLLRHRDINTTQVYAKVDEAALRALALPWPVGEL